MSFSRNATALALGVSVTAGGTKLKHTATELAWTESSLGDREAARRHYVRARALAEECGSDALLASVLKMAASTGVAGEDITVDLQDEAIRLFRSRGDRIAELVMLNNAGYWALCHGQLGRARRVLGEGLVAAEHVGSRLIHAAIICNLGLADLLDGDLAASGRQLGDGLLLGQKFGDTSVVREAIIAVAAIAAQRGEREFAVRLAAAAVSCLPDSGPFEVEALLNERYLDPLVYVLDATRHQAAAAERRRMSLESAVHAAAHAARSRGGRDGTALSDSEPYADSLRSGLR